MAATIQSIRISNLADLRALQVERQRLIVQLVNVARAEERAMRVILAQEQVGRVMPLRACHGDLPDAA